MTLWGHLDHFEHSLGSTLDILGQFSPISDQFPTLELWFWGHFWGNLRHFESPGGLFGVTSKPPRPKTVHFGAKKWRFWLIFNHLCHIWERFEIWVQFRTFWVN